jgi:hypothetical protein
LSPMALHDAPAEAAYGFRLFALPPAVASGADRLGTIDLPWLYTTRQRRRLTVLGCLPYRLRWLKAPIDWGQSIYHASDGV